jgi:hypothetical protein
MRSYANYAHYVKDTAWFDELQLKGWDTVKKYIEDNNHVECGDMLVDLQSNPADYIAKYYDMDIEEATELGDAMKAMYKDFSEKTGLDLEAEVISDEADTDGIETGFNFLVYGVMSWTLPGMNAIKADKITNASWVTTS